MNVNKMIAYVQIYIHIRKNVDIGNIIIRDNLDLFLLQKAYNAACQWMEQNNCKLTIIL